MKPARILGIDPGLSGGWAVLDGKGRLINCGHFPTHTVKKNGKNSTQLDGAGVADVLEINGYDIPTISGDLRQSSRHFVQAFVEAVSSRPRQAGQFQFGINTGLIHGVLHALNIPFDLVSPVLWKSAYGLKRAEDQTKGDMKSLARDVAAQLFPKHAEKFARVKDDGVAEAVLIARYGFLKLQHHHGD